MKTTNTLLGTVLVSLLSYQTYAQCASSNNIYSFTYNGANYEVIRENKTWEDAASCALERGGHLVEINDQAEQDALFNELNNNAGINTANTVAPDGGGASYVWIGGNDIATEGNWIWDGDNDGTGSQFWQGDFSGNPVGGLYNNWGDEPDDFGSGQDGLGLALTNWPLGVAGQWNDVAHTNSLYFVVEIPSSTGLNETKVGNSIPLYPNPAEHELTLSFNSPENPIEYCEILDLSGKTIKTIFDVQQKIEITGIEPGNYMLRTFFKNGTDRMDQFIKHH